MPCVEFYKGAKHSSRAPLAGSGLNPILDLDPAPTLSKMVRKENTKIAYYLKSLSSFRRVGRFFSWSGGFLKK
jgi:hypothetical protein